MTKVKLITFSLIVIICLLLVGCDKNKNTFSLEEKYYTNDSFNELDIDTFNNLIDDKESFAIFIYQPLCSTSYEFNEVLTEFAKDYRISFYKMPFSVMKETELKDQIKYYPSLVIYHDGKIVDYLDANSGQDANYYKSVYEFKKWFSSYVSIKEVNSSSTSSSIDKEDMDYLKIDSELENVKYDENRVNIYFFWGNGCPHCEEEFEFLESIEIEYGDYFVLNTFEVWNDENNANLLEQFANCMGDKVSGVPYTIIGEKTFKGFNEKYEKQFLEAIKTQYKNSYDVYFYNRK